MALALVAALLAASCAGSSATEDQQAATDDAPVSPTAPPAPADDAPADDATKDAEAESDTAEPGAPDEPTVDAGPDPDAAAEPTVQPVNESTEADYDERLGTLVGLLPPDTQHIFTANVDALLDGSSADDVATMLAGEHPHPTLAEPLSVVGQLAQSIDVPAALETALVAYTSNAGQPALLATVDGATLEDIVAGPMPTLDRTYRSQELYLDAAGNQLAFLPDGVLVAGTAAAVESVIDIADGSSTTDPSPVSPFVDQLINIVNNTAGFVYSLPALVGDNGDAGSTLADAVVVVGGIGFFPGWVDGTLTFHMANGAEFVDSFNALNRASTESATEAPLVLADPVVDGLDQIIATFPPVALDPNAPNAEASLAFFKKLFVGMEAFDYADGVADRSELAWLDFVVKSEANPSEPTSPGSVYIRWEFKDEAAIAAFEQNELPAGFRIAPTRFIESDDPDGEYFFALNLYNAAGGSIVGGARAEWDVFVHPPEGSDPNAGVRPRFMVVDLLAEEVSADSYDLLTPAEPLTHALANGSVVSAGASYDADGVAQPVFEMSFPVPDPAEAQVARFTREMAIGNDYIYWGHAVSDRVFYNATTFNHDAYLVDIDQMTFTDQADRWSQYLAPEVKDAVYYVNDLQYVASPMANLDSDFLDITPEWLETLVGFTTNGHQDGLMRSAVEQLFVGAGDPFVAMSLANETPSTFYHFEITNPDGLEAALDLPAGRQLAPITLFDGGEAGHYLTLSLFDEDSPEGMRAQWTVYTDDGSGRPPHMLIIDTMTEQIDFDPASILNVPDGVQHSLGDGTITTVLSSPTIAFQASFDTAGVTQQALSLDWIEAGDRVCSRNGICDLFYYDAETLDVPVDVAPQVVIDEFATPWTSFVEATPSVVFYRDNAQEYAVKRWYDLDVAVEPLPFSGLDNPTHTISGTGSLIGRSIDLVNSDYSYTGDAVLEDDVLRFAIAQEIQNTLGTANIFTTGSFDLVTASGTQTVVDCIGDALICSDIENGSTALFVAQGLDAADQNTITWRIDATVELGASFGTADSASTIEAMRIDG